MQDFVDKALTNQNKDSLNFKYVSIMYCVYNVKQVQSYHVILIVNRERKKEMPSVPTKRRR